jgi:hypothetical protein
MYSSRCIRKLLRLLLCEIGKSSRCNGTTQEYMVADDDDNDGFILHLVVLFAFWGRGAE